MNEKQLRTVVGNLRRVISPNPASRIGDAELVERFVSHCDELAFEMLVWRHGSMVLNVCRRVLRDSHEAEDAFQATFLIFVRKLRSISKHEALGSWLYKVAYRVALRARQRTALRRAESEAALHQLPGNAALDDPAQVSAWRELRPVLDEEVNRLPEKYRTAFVLYYLEGMAYAEVAQELGCPKGTVSSRLTAAKGLLRKRLLRRGVTVSAALLGAALSKTASASLTVGLTNSTMQTIQLVASGKTAGAGAVSASAVTLAEGVMKAMMMTKVKLAATLVLAVGLLGFGASVLIQQTVQGAQDKSAQGPSLKPPIVPDDQTNVAGKAPAGISLGTPTPADADPQADPRKTPPGTDKAPPQRFIDWRLIDPNLRMTFPVDDSLAARLTKIEERLTHLESQMAALQNPLRGGTGTTSGSTNSSSGGLYGGYGIGGHSTGTGPGWQLQNPSGSTSGTTNSSSGGFTGGGGSGGTSSTTGGNNPFGNPSTGNSGSSSGSSSKGATTGTFSGWTTKGPGEEKPVTINARHFKLPVAMDDKEQARIAKVELHVSRDQGIKWAFADVIDANGREFGVHVPADGEYWFKLHVIYKFGPTPEADFGTKTTPELKVLVNTKALHSETPKGDDTDTVLTDLETQLKVLQKKIADLKAKQGK